MIDLNRIYALEMMRKRRLADTVREDVAWDILVEEGGATHTIKVQCLSGQTANIDWGDGNSTTATATTMTSYAHAYPAGTFEISITGGVYGARAGIDVATYRRTALMRNMNCTGMISGDYLFGINTVSNTTTSLFDDNFRVAESITSMYYTFNTMRALNNIPSYFKFPAGLVTANRCFRNCNALSFAPLSLWPGSGFTYAGAINLIGLFGGTSIVGSIAPSQILWDSGKAFTVDRETFYPNNATAWLNYAAAYTDPVSGITYSKIPYAWGGAAD